MQKRVISTGSLLFTSVSAIIGSGWLFAAYYAATITGPAAILSWLIGCVAIMIVAFTFAELSAFVPVTGASIRVPHYTHGKFVSFIFAWIIWITYFSLMAVEVQAIIQYGSYFYPNLVQVSGGLTASGYGVATILMLIVSTINFYSLKWLLRCNSFLTILKIIIPLILGAAILAVAVPLHPHALTEMTFAPVGVKGILAALTTGGIIFAFNGFRQATEMAGEAKNPQRSLPIAIIGGILICLVVYLVLQIAFLYAVGSDASLHNWQTLKLSGTNSPFAIVLSQQNLSHYMPLLYLGAVIGPFAAALMYCSSGARALYAMSKNGSIPGFFTHLTPKGLPIVAIGVNFILGMLLFAPFKGWSAMANFLTSLMALTYIVSPICLLTLRGHMPSGDRYFKLPFAKLWSFAAFYVCTLLVYWTGWDVLEKLIVALAVGFVVMVAYRFFKHKDELLHLNWRESSWVWCFFVGIMLISHFGGFGGTGQLAFGWDFVALAVLSFLCLWLGVKFAMPAVQMRMSIAELIAEHH